MADQKRNVFHPRVLHQFRRLSLRSDAFGQAPDGLATCDDALRQGRKVRLGLAGLASSKATFVARPPTLSRRCYCLFFELIANGRAGASQTPP